MSTKKHDITPHISLMPKLGKSGYTSPQAVAELVDNSIDARINDEILEINIKIDKNVISVADNGKGMPESQLARALTLAQSDKQGQLGEYGLGLKTACTSLGDYFEVITSPKEKNEEYITIYDENEWQKKKVWEIEIESKQAEKDSHFTIVKISKLHKFWPQLAEVLKKDMERRFAPYINKKIINIRVNGKLCKPESPELIEGSKKKFEISLTGEFDGKNIYGWYGLLKEGSNKGLYGFHTFRRGRMITTYDKIAIGEHPTLSRIVGEINLDFVPVSHNKKEFIKESDEYSLAESLLKEEFKEIAREARNKSGQDKITKQVVNELESWKDKISRAVIESPDLKYYTSQIDKKTGMVKNDLGEKTEIQSESRDEGDSEGSVQPKGSSVKRMPKKFNPNKKKIIRIKGKTFEFEHKFVSLGQDSAWKDYEFNEEKKKLVIFTNTDFPAYLATKDTTFYAVLHIAESISEVMVKEVGEEIGNMQEIKETILKAASTFKMQI